MESPTIFYICNDFERALGLEKVLPNYHIVCIDYNEGIEAARDAGIKIFCLEEALSKKNPIYRNSNRLLNVNEVQEYIKTNTPKGETPNVMFFKIAANIEQTCKRLGYKILNTSTELNQAFELKLSQYEKLHKTVRFPETHVDQLQNVTYEELTTKLGSPFVIQYDRGHTGSSTVFVDTKEVFENERSLFPSRTAKFSQKIEGNAWTLNACVTRDGIAYGGLCFQITGITQCTSKKGGTVGNDWSATDTLSEKTLEQIKTITVDSGEVMKKSGYRGLYGLDLIVDPQGEVYFIEINARQPASTGLHTKLMLANEQIPLEAFHIAEFLFKDQSEDYYEFLNTHFNTQINRANAMDFIAKQNLEAIKPLRCAQIIMRNTASEDVIANSKYQTGVYKLFDDKIVFVRYGCSIDNIEDSKEEFLLLNTSNDRIISPEAEVGRIQKKATLLSQDLLPSQDAIRIINIIKQN